MAQALRRHVFPSPRSPFSFSNPRHFSIITPRQASRIDPSQHPDRRMRMQAMSGNQMATDMGLLPNTFIASKVISLLKSPKNFSKYQWKRVKTRFWDAISTAAFKWMSPKTGRISRKVQLKRGSIVAAAEALYRNMYQNFAAGNTGYLRRICTDGLYESFAKRIASRPKGQRVSWALQRMNKSPKIMSTKAAMLPGGEGNVIRQAVVRISSRQTINMSDARGKPLPGSSEKDVVEYVVMQKIYRNWQDGEWQVWGMAQPTTMSRIAEWDKMA